MEPRVLIGCPTHISYNYCVDEYLQAARSLTFKNYQLVLVDNSPDDRFYRLLKHKGVDCRRIDYIEPARERIVRSRSLLRQIALDGGFDYFLSLEQDNLVQPDTLARLLSHQKPIVSAYYGTAVRVLLKDDQGGLHRATIELPIAYLKDRDGTVRRAVPEEVVGKGLLEAGALGLGCCLIASEVLRKVSFRYVAEKAAFDDMCFSEDALASGYQLLLDSDTAVRHVHRQQVRGK